MDKKKSLLNVAVSVGFKLVTMVMSIIVKRALIRYCGNEVNGLNALYLSVIGFMSVAELGVGFAITFSMYKPVVEGDTNRVSALYFLFRRIYRIIGAIILVCGLVITPFVHLLAKDYAELDVNLQYTFILMLISTVLTYLYSAKTALFNAHKNNYITTAINQGGILFQYFLQLTVLAVVGTFESYLICRILSCLFQWLVTEIIVRRNHSDIIANKQSLDRETRTEVTKNIKAVFIHHVGYVLINTVDSVVIAAFVGVVVLGEYSNYAAILTSLTAVLKLVFSSLTSVFGHLYVQEDHNVARKYCEAFHFLNFIISLVFFLGYYAIIDNLIALLFAADLVVEKSISFVVTLNGFVQFMRQSTITFRDATGTFYYDRWLSPVEGIVNVVFSVILVKLFGVAGVILATIGTNLLICHVVEPFVVYRFAFSASPKRYYVKNYLYIGIFTLALLLLNICMFDFDSQWLTLLANGVLSVGVSCVVCLAVAPFNRDEIRCFIKNKGEK
jgi:O-antigen/teichoic acid export membrane protein